MNEWMNEWNKELEDVASTKLLGEILQNQIYGGNIYAVPPHARQKKVMKTSDNGIDQMTLYEREIIIMSGTAVPHQLIRIQFG